MDVVYICRDGENEELRYSIRSVVKNLKHDKIWVVGGKPKWYDGNHISVPQPTNKASNARNNMWAIANSEEISDDFILMNDDFFIMEPVEKPEYYYSGLLRDKVIYFKRKYPASGYTKLLAESHRMLRRLGITAALDYTLHVPMIMNKAKLKEILGLKISWRLAYGNIYHVGGIQVEAPDPRKDVKIYLEKNGLTSVESNPLSKTYLSTDDSSFPLMKKFFQKEFPDPSPFEKYRKRRKSTT